MKFSKFLSIMLAAAFLFILFAGCGNDSATETDDASATDAVQSETVDDGNQNDVTEPQEDSSYFPLVEDGAELSVWTTLGMSWGSHLTSWSEHTVMQEYEKWTNVHIEYTEVSNMEVSDAFNIMIAGEDYTDMVGMLDNRYAGGASKALEDGVIIQLEGLAADFAPDYIDVINANDTALKDAYTDEGYMLAVYSYNQENTNDSGLLIRQDWLDEQGLSIPETYDEIEEVLEVFKTEYDCDNAILVDENGLCSQFGAFVGGYGTKGFVINAPADMYSSSEFYQIDGVLQCSFLDDSYRDYLAMLNEWYTAGYFSPDWVNIAGFQDAWIPYLTDDSCGLFYGTTSLASYLESNTDMQLTAITEPTLESGDYSRFFNVSSLRAATTSVSITVDCEDPELAMRWLNGFFTEEGMMMANWGVEDYTWEYVDGVPQFTEFFTDQIGSDAVAQLLQIYGSFGAFPTVYLNADYSLHDDETMQMLELWSSPANGDGSGLLPRGLALTTDESAEYSILAADFETYASEHIAKFIVGDENVMEMWDEFQSTILSMNLDKCMEIYQAALTRYIER